MCPNGPSFAIKLVLYHIRQLYLVCKESAGNVQGNRRQSWIDAFKCIYAFVHQIQHKCYSQNYLTLGLSYKRKYLIIYMNVLEYF